MTNSTKIKRRYSWIPDVPDHRDFLFGKLNKIPETLPESVDLREFCSKVEDQGALGSCTANAIVGALEYLENKDKKAFEDLSRLFVYYNERVIEHTVDTDSGAMIRDGIKSLVHKGCCTEKLWQYDITKFAKRPNSHCYKDGLTRKITSYQRVDTVDEMRSCIADGYPVIFGFAVYESFESQDVATTGIVPMPTEGEKMLGGHAVLSVAYDMNKKIFPESIGSALSRNSWGPDWGLEGYFWIPLEYLANRSLSDDFWTIRKGKNI